MKATRYILTAALVALLALSAQAAVYAVFTAKATTGASDAIDTGNSKYVRVHIWRADAAAASTAVVTIQQSTNATDWYTVATITNPTGRASGTAVGGEAWSVPSIAYTRLYVTSITTGTITATIEIQR